jgi:hypothetical protein
MFELIAKLKRTLILRQMAKFFAKVDRRPLLRTPSEAGLVFNEVDFKASDGVNLKAWFIPCEGSNKLVVFNHFMLGNRSGAKPDPNWGDISVDFIQLYKLFHDQGYNVFTYDLRNHGESAIYDGGKLGLTHTEANDAIGAMDYIKECYPNMRQYLYSQCYGTVTTMRAIHRAPERFKDVRAYVSLQPLSPKGFVEGISKNLKISHADNVKQFVGYIEKQNGYNDDDLNVTLIAPSTKMPVLMSQVRRDFRTTEASIQEMFEALGSIDKEMFWIDEHEERLEGYNYFWRDNPTKLFEWLNRY